MSDYPPFKNATIKQTCLYSGKIKYYRPYSFEGSTEIRRVAKENDLSFEAVLHGMNDGLFSESDHYIWELTPTSGEKQ